jgi:hypothetical protein
MIITIHPHAMSTRLTLTKSVVQDVLVVQVALGGIAEGLVTPHRSTHHPKHKISTKQNVRVAGAMYRGEGEMTIAISGNNYSQNEDR